MASKKTKLSRWRIIASLVVLSLLAITHIFATHLQTMFGYSDELESHQTTKDKIADSGYYVSYIDVGQGNSSFVQLPDGKNILIDGGDKEYGETVADFLNDRNVTQIDYLIATHSDSDHIGGLLYVLENFEIKNIYRPFQISMVDITGADDEVYEHEDLSEVYEYITSLSGDDSKINKVTTKIYKDFIKAIYSETYTLSSETLETQVCVFYDGLKISGENYELEFFAPIKHSEDIDLSQDPGETKGYATVGYTNANDCSAIFTLTCFDDKYLFMGDARFSDDSLTDLDYSEWDFIQSLTQAERAVFAEVDVLLLPHHGSKTSASTELLELVLPRFAVVSAGADNSYGHPSAEVLERLKTLSSLEDDYLVRTDEMGDIIFTSIDGELSYYSEKQGTNENLKLSFRLLCVVVAVFLITLVWSIKKPRKKKARR